MADTTDIEVQLIKALKLPNTIQGDGRYVLSLLKQYLEDASVQINLANGFSPEEINPTSGSYTMPKNLILTFDKSGGLFSWSHLTDLSDFAYYELRTNTDVGYGNGVIYRGTDNYTTIMPEARSGTVYLYACSKDGTYSNPNTLDYTKAYAEHPTDISVTQTAEGSLITFSEIPSNCIGAYVYIGGARYDTKTNMYLYPGTINADYIEIAYYDDFGIGEKSTYSMKLPDVTGFLVERNDAQLDFYWDNINSYGVKYLVKVCTDTEPSWEHGIELFRTATNDKNRQLYPNTGSYYLMVKAYDDSGRYSENAAYQLMNNEPSIDRNIILEYDQQDVLYSGNKINVYYDATLEGVTLDRDASKGEYIFDIDLGKEYRARNWLEVNAVAVSNNNVTWDDMDMGWDESASHWAGVVGNIDSSQIKYQLAYKETASDSNLLFNADLNGTVNASTAATVEKNQHTDSFMQGRWNKGLAIGMNTELAYKATNLQRTFTLSFWLKTTEALNNCAILSLANDSTMLILGYDSYNEEFYLRGSDGSYQPIPIHIQNKAEYYFIGVSQGTSERRLFIYTYSSENSYSSIEKKAPLGTFNKIYCYSKITI